MSFALFLLALAPDFARLPMLPQSQGEWRYRVEAGGSVASFGTTFELRCERATRRVRITLGTPGQPLTPGLTIVTDTATRMIAADGNVAAFDPLLAAIAFSRGRFGVGREGGAFVAIPVGPEAARSIEDCR